LKIGIIYSTKREKATVSVIEWLFNAFEEEGVEAEAGRPDEMNPGSYDGLVIGSAVYAGKVQADILEFVTDNKSLLSNKPFATFIVCKETEEPECHMSQILQLISDEPLTQQFFEGYMIWRRNFDEQEIQAKEWASEIVNVFSKHPEMQ
jgi:menaquinone-dependent protoporphyrinogen IX oxidase